MKRKIIFLHLDLGIGGAEQLVLNLATASDIEAHNLSIYTAHCSPDHCFDQVKPHTGSLYKYLRIRGSFIPAKLPVLGMRAAFSTIRMLYLTFFAVLEIMLLSPSIIYSYRNSNTKAKDDETLFVIDVLPTPIPFLKFVAFLLGRRKSTKVIYYCHFPDKLLIQNTTHQQQRPPRPLLQSINEIYRKILDSVEEWSMSYADLIVVNSHFTKRELCKTFNIINSTNNLQVLHPAVEFDNFLGFQQIAPKNNPNDNKQLVLSLNRFERKKNLELVVNSIIKISKWDPEIIENIKVVIAGGYDPLNEENVSYLEELKDLVKQHDHLNQLIEFRTSVSDQERASLLERATCLLYTPHREHFGIVPIEAMYSQTPVIAVNSGGPMETILNGKTGFLCDGECTKVTLNEHSTGIPNDDELAESFGRAILKLVRDPKLSRTMGMQGREHTTREFGLELFQNKWLALLRTVTSEK